MFYSTILYFQGPPRPGYSPGPGHPGMPPRMGMPGGPHGPGMPPHPYAGKIQLIQINPHPLIFYHLHYD